MSSRSESSTGGASGVSPKTSMSAVLPLTTASVPAYDSSKMLENALSIVSVRT